jgi:N-formylglutamate amidohydrolase
MLIFSSRPGFLGDGRNIGFSLHPGPVHHSFAPMADIGAKTPFHRIGPEESATPVVISVPHAGRDYSADLLAAARVPRETLQLLEDPYVDQLVQQAVMGGVQALIATAPRAEIDLNRSENALDPAMVFPPPAKAVAPSLRTRSGLGLVPARISGAGSIWKNRVSAEEIVRRVETVYRPYHQCLSMMLEAARKRFGIAILLDCHSMPGRSAGASGQVVFGDRHGSSAAPYLVKTLVDTAQSQGFSTACNAPYAGGEITRRHAEPRAGIHAIQIELDRGLYLTPDCRSLGSGFERTASLIARMTDALAETALGRPSIAAE